MQALSDKIGQNQIAKITYECMDCKNEFVATITRISETEMEIDNAIVGVRKSKSKSESKSDLSDRYVFKCLDCYERDKNFGSICDVYSRVVGFMRPISYWNDAKKEEFKMRKVYNMPNE